jgi:signal transduction histidine kinase
VLRPVSLRGDTIMRGATLVHLLVALSIAAVHQTWAAALVVGLCVTAGFWLCAWRWPGQAVTRFAAAAALMTFCALYLYQLGGMPEADAFVFTSLTLLILYKDPAPMWRAALGYLVAQALLTRLSPAGWLPEDGLRELFSTALITTQVVLASVVARTLRLRTLNDARLLEASEQLGRELQQTRARLVQSEKLAAAGQLAAGVGHEINNPLAFVIGNLDYSRHRLSEARELLAALPDGEDVLAALEEAEEGAHRIAAIVRDLKTFARSDSDRLGPVDVKTSIEFALSMARPQIRHRAVVERDYAEVPKVDATETRLGQVFLVLLINAAQALKDGGSAENRIRVKTTLDPDGRVRASVSDTGRGISAEHLSRVFDPFFTTRPGEGTGLGLSIAHNVVTTLGGALEVESLPGQGATFHVVLPASTSEARVRSEKAPPGPVEARPPARVLVIDDEPHLGQLVARMLGPDTATVSSALSGREGLALIERQEFDLVLCDVMMPDIGGPEVYRTIADRHPRLLPRVVMMTGGAFTDESAAFVASLPSAVLEKPFGAAELSSLIALVRTRAA